MIYIVSLKRFMDAFIAVVGQRVGDYSLLTGKLYNVEESAKIGLIVRLTRNIFNTEGTF